MKLSTLPTAVAVAALVFAAVAATPTRALPLTRRENSTWSKCT